MKRKNSCKHILELMQMSSLGYSTKCPVDDVLVAQWSNSKQLYIEMELKDVIRDIGRHPDQTQVYLKRSFMPDSAPRYGAPVTKSKLWIYKSKSGLLGFRLY